MAPIEGFWGKPTSTIDWCEENYVVTYYIAEFWNTISNLAMILPSLGGFYYSYKNNLEKRIMLCFLSLTLVGFGSWGFHMTLLYEMQLGDEMPMIWGGLILIYVLITHLNENYEKNFNENFLLKLLLCFFGLLTTIIYLSFKTPIIFQLSYAILVTWLLYLDICVLNYKNCSKLIFYLATICFYVGFILWLIDNFYCENLRSIRRQYYLLNPFTQLHAWWHVLAGYGSYLHILFCTHSKSLNLKKFKKPLKFKYVWYIGIALDFDDRNNNEDGNKKK